MMARQRNHHRRKTSYSTLVFAVLIMFTFVILFLLALGILSLPSNNGGSSKANDLTSIVRKNLQRSGKDVSENERWVEIISWEPRASIYHNFLTKEECKYLIELAKPHMEKSTVVDQKTGKSTDSRVRTSSGTFLPRGRDKIIRQIEKRISDFTFIPVEHGEGLQVLHYEIGQKYEPHYDYFMDEYNTRNGGQRIATVLMYLSDVEEGGETVFPSAKGNYSAVPWWNELSECGKGGLSVKPKMGDALLFWSMTPDATLDPSSLHGGCAVIKGNKWSSTKWLREEEAKREKGGVGKGKIQTKIHPLLRFFPFALAKKSERKRDMDRYPLLLLHRIKDCFHSAISSLLANLFSALFTFVFALVGTLLGAFTGALIGQETESGFIRGAAVGAISGAVFSIDVLESSLLLWQSDQSGIACLLYLIDVIASLLSGRLVRERIGPAMLSAVQNQMGAVESQFPNQTDIFDTAISNGLTGDSLDRIPKVRITDTSGEMVSCSVCLQDFKVGETVRILPQCYHTFHLPCIDKWLCRHASCPFTANSASAFFPPCDKDKKPVWNKPCISSSPPLMGADSWPALSPLSSHKSPSSKGLSDGSSPMPQEAAATSSDYHSVNGQRKPFRRNNSTSSSNPHPNADQNHTQRNGAATTQSRNPHHRHHRNGSSSYPGNRQRNVFEHGHSNGRGDMHLQPQRGVGTMRPQMLMGPPSSTQYMAAAPQIGSYGGPMLYPPDYALHVFMPHPPPESIALVGNFPPGPPPPIYFPSFDPMLSNKILTQVEYYFSADNLSKDEHLRGQMNDDGWVPVRIIARFRRLTELTDNIQTILEALRSSEVVEIKGEALRRRGDWDKYLLPHGPSSSGPAASLGGST
ncbi:unnamed protein product [Brassica rapa subsp. trilocularis]